MLSRVQFQSDQATVTERIRGSNVTSVSQLGGRLQLAVARLDITPDLRPCAIPRHSKFQGHSCRSSVKM